MASTVVSLIGAVLVSARIETGVSLGFAVAFVAGTIGVLAMITGATFLTRETRFSFAVLREEKNFLAERIRERVAGIAGSTPVQET